MLTTLLEKMLPWSPRCFPAAGFCWHPASRAVTTTWHVSKDHHRQQAQGLGGHRTICQVVVSYLKALDTAEVVDGVASGPYIAVAKVVVLG